MSQVETPTPIPVPVKHGVVVLHGAGMPENDKTIVGDPLSTIAYGLVDALQWGYIAASIGSR